MKRFVTSESVTEGHPDKICDKISDKILDIALEFDKESKMAVECTIKNNIVFIYGEATTKAKLDYENITKWVLKDIGYEEEFKVIIEVSNQSPEINNAVEKDNIGAGDQGIMFGYATNETEEYMPLPSLLANKLTQKLTKVRKEEKNSPLKPDGKSQVTVEYEDNIPKRIDTIVVASQHIKKITQEKLRKYIKENVIDKVIPTELVDKDTKILINTSGSFVIGGPFGDSGTTGRKIVVDSYGGSAKVGGGCFSSKDPTKVDRSAAYYARYVAKNIVHHGLADICEIGLSYTIGSPNPIEVNLETYNTNKISLEEIYKFINNNFNFSVSNIIKELDLKRPIYYQTAAYGHFGRTDIDLPWEHIKRIQ
ncbi:MAG: methionine adenosyltransferase [Bacilli bacterium]|nr:methionine adenosyltransferase [Bacilli bacterium]